MPTQEFVVIDTETTGLYKNDRIIEIACVVFNRDAMVTATIYAHVSNEQAETALIRFAEATKLA